jgi:hypothetical protein
MIRYAVLAAKLQNELNKVQAAVRSALSQAEKAKNTGDNDFLIAAAFSLQNFYMGTERIFEEVAKQIDHALPTGESSHRALYRTNGVRDCQYTSAFDFGGYARSFARISGVSACGNSSLWV